MTDKDPKDKKEKDEAEQERETPRVEPVESETTPGDVSTPGKKP